MNIILTFLSFCLLAGVLYKTLKIQKTELLRKKLVSNYDKIELYILKNRKYLSKQDILFLNVNKNIAVNPQFLDFEVMIAIQRRTKRVKSKIDFSWYPKYILDNGVEFKELMDSYYKVQVQLTLLSALKINFIFKFLIFRLNHLFNHTKISLNDIVQNKINNTLYSNKAIPEMGLC